MEKNEKYPKFWLFSKSIKNFDSKKKYKIKKKMKIKLL